MAGVGVLLLTSACSDGQGSASTPTTAHDDASQEHEPALDPCTLVTEAEAEAVLGPIAEHREDTDPIFRTVEDQRVCVFTLESDPEVGANVGFADFEAAAKFDSFRDLFADQVEEVDGLGEHAVWVEQFRVLLVLDRPELLSVQMTEVGQGLDKAVSKKKAIELATVALDRFPKARARG